MITSPISFTPAEVDILRQVCPRPREADGSVWDEVALAAVRASIKTHYVIAQSHTCCYCNRHMPTNNHRMWDVEHVVARSTHPQFLFEPRNLAVSCPDCNTAKGRKRSLRNNSRVTYPAGSDDFVIVHPHFDEYDEHIVHIGYIYLAKTDKGRRTIYDCDLLRFSQEFLSWPSDLTDDRYEREVEVVISEGHHALEVARALASRISK